MNETLYYDQGYFCSKLDENIEKILWNEIYSTEWKKDDVEYIYKEIPTWYEASKKYPLQKDGSDRAEYERLIGEDIFSKTPSTLIDVGYSLIQTVQFDFFKKYYKTPQLKYIDLWNGSEDIPYHFDTINGCDTLVLIYLTDREWKAEWGGSITMKKQVNDNVVYENKILPNNATMLVINNANPLVYHKVEKLKNNDINRYTFSFIYNWF